MTLFYATTNLKDTRGIVVHVAFCALLMIHVFCGKIVAIIEKRTELCSRFSSLLSQPNHYKTKCQKTLASLAFQRFILVMLSILMISFLVLSFFGSNLNSRWQQRDWMEERGEFPTRFIIARRSRPTTTRTIGPPSSHWAPCEQRRRQRGARGRESIRLHVHSYFMERENTKKESEKRLILFKVHYKSYMQFFLNLPTSC